MAGKYLNEFNSFLCAIGAGRERWNAAADEFFSQLQNANVGNVPEGRRDPQMGNVPQCRTGRRRRNLHRGAAQGRYRLPHMTPAI
jgi:hypothetical protein